MSDTGDAALIGVCALFVGFLLGALAMWLMSRHRSSEVDRVEPVTEPDTAPAELHALVLDRAPLAVLALDPDENVLVANRRAHQLGLLDRRGVVDELSAVARAGRATATTRELSLPTVGLPRRVLQARVSTLPLPDRVVALVVEDVTEARRVDDVRRDFVANVSHEIKTPVGALSLLAEAALESIGDPDDAETARHFVERISRESARLGRLVSELLDLSRLQGAEARPDPLPVSLDDVVAEAIDRATPHADAREITIRRSGPSHAVVPGVETQLVTAVANLLDNAINYSPEATRVAVAVRRREASWEITVTDQGLGIPEADIDRIFERFYRVDPARSRATGGTGLGLAIVKHIVRNHGGEVRVWSSPGAGSSFTLCLPGYLPSATASAASSADPSTSPPPAAPAPARSTEILHDTDRPGDATSSPTEQGVSAARSSFVRERGRR